MRPRPLVRFLFAALASGAALWLASCAVPLGPGYEIQKQTVAVRFESTPEPVLHVDAEYQLKNTGTRPLANLELRLPARRFHVANLTAAWDAAGIAPVESPHNPRNSLLQFPEPWAMNARHTLRLAFEIRRAAPEERGLGFTSSAFFLPEGGWSPEFVQPRGLFGIGGVPPQKWDLLVSVPEDFRVHASGARKKRFRKHGRLQLRFQQTPRDLYPFVVAGRYSESALVAGARSMSLWTLTALPKASLADMASILERELNAYDAALGTRSKKPIPLWIVECPQKEGCISGRNAPFARFFGEEAGAANAEMISLDTVLVDSSGDLSRIAAIAAPSLAASWLGYGRNPGFYEQEPPLSALPLFAAALGREAVQGPDARSVMIGRALAQIPAQPKPGAEQDPAVERAKGFLFFYALRDLCGEAAFRNAIRHMLSARQGRGFNLDDLIAAFEQETHQNIAEFVRLWMKHPGVPQEFRERYAAAQQAIAPLPEEQTP